MFESQVYVPENVDTICNALFKQAANHHVRIKSLYKCNICQTGHYQFFYILLEDCLFDYSCEVDIFCFIMSLPENKKIRQTNRLVSPKK